jgi:hypothetical protein
LAALVRRDQPPDPHLYAVFDMVSDRDLRIGYEAPKLRARSSVSCEVGGRSRLQQRLRPQMESALMDDHVALQRAGIHAIDVVDFTYGPGNSYWHTTEDTIDKVSANSLQIVGDVAVALVRGVGQ